MSTLPGPQADRLIIAWRPTLSDMAAFAFVILALGAMASLLIASFVGVSWSFIPGSIAVAGALRTVLRRRRIYLSADGQDVLVPHYVFKKIARARIREVALYEVKARGGTSYTVALVHDAGEVYVVASFNEALCVRIRDALNVALIATFGRPAKLQSPFSPRVAG